MHKIKTAKNRLIALLLSAVLVLAAMPISGVLAAAADTKTAGASGEVWDGTAATAFAGGDGSAENPYQIATAGQLKLFADTVNGGSRDICGVLTADIVLNEGDLTNYDGASANDWEPWTPIGDQEATIREYEGVFDGQGHTVSGIYYNNTEKNYIGLFGLTVGSTMVIKNVGVVNSYINGNNYVGGVCGSNNGGTIENCYNTGMINGTYYVGGMCGFASSGTIKNSYNTGKVSGTEDVGGVCGASFKIIDNCYNAGTISGLGRYIGGICGLNVGTVTNCYYLSGAAAGGLGLNSGSEDVAGSASPLEADKMTGTTALDNMGFSAEDWFVSANYYGIKYFPQLKVFENNQSAPLPDNAVHISTAAELKAFAARVNAGENALNGVLMKDIVLNEGDLSGYDGTSENTWVQWAPIGNAFQNYAGTFDGQGHTVSGLYFDDVSANYAGLFGQADEGATIANVGVVNSYINGAIYVSGICGQNHGIIENCYSTGSIYGVIQVGGVCGVNWALVENCYNTGRICGNYNIGGVCGFVETTGTIRNCFNTGKISAEESFDEEESFGGQESFGGICGANTNLVESCYNTGAVNAPYTVGGICGASNFGTVKNCFNTGAVNTLDGEAAGGICGMNNSGDMISCYNTGVITGDRYVGGLSGQSDGTFTNCYYLSGTANGGIGNAMDATGEDVAGSASALSLGQMTGESALDNMTGFSAEDWFTTADDYSIKYFPQLKVFENNPSAPLPDNAIHISTADELTAFAVRVNAGEIGLNARLTANIVLNTGTFDENGMYTPAPSQGMAEQWTPIGSNSGRYSGTFDGDGHTVSGLYFSDTSTDFAGLFGATAQEATIANVGVVNSFINGNGYVGGVCGDNFGTITACYSNAIVNAALYAAGGLCGGNFGKVINGYNAGKIHGESQVGGICGFDDAGSQTVNCYNIGAVSANGNVGAICGVVYPDDFSTETNNYYLAGTASYGIGTTNGSDVTGAAEPLSFGQMTGSGALTNMKLDESIWNTKTNTAVSADGETETLITVSGYFPQLKVFGNTNISVTSTFSKMKTETVGETEYYLIYTASQLKTFANIVNGTLTEDEKSVGYTATPYANAKLMANIVLNPGTFDTDGNYTAVSGETPEQWTPIGKVEDVGFAGVFQGQGHTVSGLYINSKSGVGLFGYTTKNQKAVIADVGVVNGYVKGNYYTGSVCGYLTNQGTITGCFNLNTTVKGYSEVGGVCGGDHYAAILNCFNTGLVSGTKNTGGICGNNGVDSFITNCFNTGSVSGGADTGSLYGKNRNTSANTAVNSYYLENSCVNATNTGGTSKNEDEFKSGEVAYLLNGSVTDSTNIWFQTVEADKAPSFDPSRGSVYYSKVYGYTNGFMPSYFVTIPEKVSLGNTEQITLSDVDIGDGQQVTVTLMTTELSLANENKTKINYTITDDDNEPVSGTVLTAANKAEAAKALHFNAPAGYICAGDYKGTLTFHVAVKEGN